jgi:hypothetical protein
MLTLFSLFLSLCLGASSSPSLSLSKPVPVTKGERVQAGEDGVLRVLVLLEDGVDSLTFSHDRGQQRHIDFIAPPTIKNGTEIRGVIESYPSSWDFHFDYEAHGAFDGAPHVDFGSKGHCVEESESCFSVGTVIGYSPPVDVAIERRAGYALTIVVKTLH